ncbi:MAG TPA: hypothetical protein VKN82_03425 [Desulfohalobiaceae bacterium]|nr:hypothetical protein [Desulfohalobiaceae bacterium]
MAASITLSNYRKKWRDAKNQICHCCGRECLFCWRCRCGFKICQECMQENSWAMTCNGITWVCPDCGELNGYGNQ